MQTRRVAENSDTVAKTETGWDSEHLFVDGDGYFNSLLAAAETARRSLLVESYIFENDTLGQRFLETLLRAQERGVDVRLLVDGVGSANFIARGMKAAQAGGLNIRVYHPLPWQILPSRALIHAAGLRSLLKVFSYANSRNHRKIVIIDDSIAFAGSMNVSEVHLGECLGSHAWHDFGVRVSGGACDVLRGVFLRAWHLSWRGEAGRFLRPPLVVRSYAKVTESALVIRNDGRRLRRRSLAQRLEVIRSVRKRLWIANAYFVPNGQLLRALMAAARRGVDVRILLPQISDVQFMPWVARAFYESLIKYGVRVYEYTPRVLHAKTMLADDEAWVGSSNLNHRSLLHDYELDLVLSSPRLVSQLGQKLGEDFRSAREIVKLNLAGQPLLQRLMAGILLYFRNLL